MAHHTGEHREEGGGQRGPLAERCKEPKTESERREAVIGCIHSLGVTLSIKDEEFRRDQPLRVLEAIVDGLNEADMYGSPLPDVIEIDSGYLPESANIEEEHGQLVIDDRTEKTVLIINPRSKIFRNNMTEAEQVMKDHFEERWCSTGNPLHAIRHELSHLFHWKQDPKSFKKEKFDHPSDMILAHDHVSKYASDDPGEFVAEVRAALLNGKRFGSGADDFPEEVKALYLHYSGGLRQ